MQSEWSATYRGDVGSTGMPCDRGRHARRRAVGLVWRSAPAPPPTVRTLLVHVLRRVPQIVRAVLSSFLDEPETRRLLVYSDGKDLQAVSGVRNRCSQHRRMRRCSHAACSMLHGLPH